LFFVVRTLTAMVNAPIIRIASRSHQISPWSDSVLPAMGITVGVGVGVSVDMAPLQGVVFCVDTAESPVDVLFPVAGV
jgi:hypothetical protein